MITTKGQQILDRPWVELKTFGGQTHAGPEIYHSEWSAGLTRTGRAYNYAGEVEQFDPFASLQDALEWADFVGFTHYERNGKRRRIPPQYRLAA